jgi:hypothetical protein
MCTTALDKDTSGNLFNFGTRSGKPIMLNDYIGFAVDSTSGKIWPYHSGVPGWLGDPAAGIGGYDLAGGPWKLVTRPRDGGAIRLNTSAAQLRQAPPTGFSALDS